MLGRPQVRLIDQQCTGCGQADSWDIYHQLVPPGGNYAYDLIVEVGLARFRDQRQDTEIQRDLKCRWGLTLPASSIGLLVDSFLDGLAAVHQSQAPVLRQRLAEDGGHVLHVDGTCEPETDVLFTAVAQPHGWTLEVAKMTTENTLEISKLMRRCVEQFGQPLAVVRDLSTNIEKAKREAIPQARDLICQYHFLENVGEKLCEKPHSKLTAALRRLKIRATLRSLRKDQVRGNRKGRQLSKAQIEHLVSHPQEIEAFDAVTLRRLVAYLLLRWLDDYTADLQGEYFPFDLPSLAFYRRGLQLGEMLDQLVGSSEFPQQQLSTFVTIARHLALLREDEEVVTAAARLEKAAVLFEELRNVLRLNSRRGQPLLRGRDPREAPDVADQLKKHLEEWRDRLQQRHDREPDAHRRADQATVLKYLRKYEKQLVGHVIPVPGRQQPLVARRTNNPVEHRFGSTKRQVRRRLGSKKLTRQVQAMRAEALLACNLADDEYVNLVLGGTLNNLPDAMAAHWKLAQAIRKDRLAPTTEHPIPATKKQIRNPGYLDNLSQIVQTMVEVLTRKRHAA